MKKTIFGIIAILVLATLVACGQKEKHTQIANPWTNHETLGEACCAVNFNMTFPEHIEGYGDPTFRTMNDELIEIIFPADNDEICIRKAIGGEAGNDISGDYSKYSEHTAVHNDKIDGEVAGNDGIAYKATWQNDDFSYSITAQSGIEMGTMYGLIDATR